MMGFPSILLFISKIDPTDFITLLFFKICNIITPQIWTRHAVTDYINQIKIIT